MTHAVRLICAATALIFLAMRTGSAQGGCDYGAMMQLQNEESAHFQNYFNGEDPVETCEDFRSGLEAMRHQYTLMQGCNRQMAIQMNGYIREQTRNFTTACGQ